MPARLTLPTQGAPQRRDTVPVHLIGPQMRRWEKAPATDRPLIPGRVRRRFSNIRCLIGTPLFSNPLCPDHDDRKDHAPAQPNATPVAAKADRRRITA